MASDRPNEESPHEELCYRPAHELASLIRRGACSSREVVQAHLDRIEAYNEDLHAFITVVEESALEQARERDEEVQRGRIRGPLHGVPVAIKDLIGFVSGVRHTYGARPFQDYVPREDAISVQRLKGAGAVILGKTNTPEFGWKGKTENMLPWMGQTVTPYDHSRISGGSSGGSAAALAQGMTPLATGSDYGGSCRNPAGACGVFGMKPTDSRIAHAHRPDAFISNPPFFQQGPLARSVEDAALMLEVMAGPDPRDPFALPEDGTRYYEATRVPLDELDLSVAYNRNMGVYQVDHRVESVIEGALETLEEAGVTVTPVELDIGYDFQAILEAYVCQFVVMIAQYTQMAAENYEEADLDLLGKDAGDLPDDLVEMLREGHRVEIDDYRAVNRVRTGFNDALTRVFEDHDVLVAPTLAVPPFDKTIVGPTEVDGVEIDPWGQWVMTWMLNFSGQPGASVPAGFTEDEGLPVGMQVMAPRYEDDTLLSAAASFERINPWDHAYPPYR